MLAVIILFVLGFGVGFLIKKRIKSVKPIEKLTTAAIWILLFVLGVGVGANSLVMENIQKLGWWAFVVAFGAVAGSIAAMAIVQHFFFKKEDGQNER